MPAITDWLLRTVQPQLATLAGVQRVTNNEGGRQIAMRVWIDMRDALKEITKTLGETILIVGFAVFLFMGSMRTALVPLVAMPVSLVGAAIVMLALGSA